ncbi:unnamed protein product [Rotaria magnacalcarata]|nr:unnamed protein product [Rotaria magnacalcarata]CAF1470218.1 unnamed protein product [Rotaria magnacalcarata]CAF2127080.1 unnamed protein product [Rotaria magnacalcarata]CAF2150811.1 unnamed protein product [Rotaria magnacalcarata]CAF2157240.1 unnamed protein product [Rotaria magnacalcarata]
MIYHHLSENEKWQLLQKPIEMKQYLEMPKLRPLNEKIEGGDRVVFDNRRQMHCCYFAPNTIGKHKITIYAKKRDTVDTYHNVLSLALDVNEIPRNPISFPQTWKNFFDLNMKIVSPKHTHLIRVHNEKMDAEVMIRTPDVV